jgi:tetratricopeptide (TPR) repeat protein
MIHAMGGKNMFFFLTPLEKGKLQVLPIAYNVRKGTWYDTMGSMVRHFQGAEAQEDQALHWTDPMMTFNTACYSCHVSQLTTNYDQKDGSYNTVWQEPGINCETCHGPASEHIRIYAGKPKDFKAKDQKLVVWRDDLTPLQRDQTCAPCHAKMHAITEKFGPGDRYFDHHDLATFEDRDFYPDGRDLGENYTYSLWLTNPCVKAGKLECIHCHTSSGRNRHAKEPNNACLPCHKARVENPTKHTHHKPKSKGNLCVSCHAPKTMFSHMERSDHSFRPPTPAAMIEFKSPSACNNCHKDKTPEFLDKKAREWHGQNYQDDALARGRLIDAAHKGNWTKVDAMLTFLKDPKSDGIFVNSLIRLMANCPDMRKFAVFRKLLKHPMPIVRSSAATALRDAVTIENAIALLEACSDDYRLVRIRAANALAAYPDNFIPGNQRKAVAAATKELETSFDVRPDQWGYHYNRGNYLMDKQRHVDALNSYETAHKLRDDTIMPLVNGAMAAARAGKPNKGLKFLEKAREISPEDQGVLFNLGLLYNELKQPEKAKAALYGALKSNPRYGQAAYNLGLLVVNEDPAEGIRLLRIASENSPNRPDCGYWLAHYLEENGQKDEARKVYEALDKRPDLPPQLRNQVRAKLQQLRE